MLTDRLFARSARSSRKPTDSSPSRWHHGPWWSNSYLLTPLISILVFLVVMSLILWSLNRREQQQQEDTLYRNVAWAQQQIRLSMTGAQEQIQALARDIVSGHGDPQIVPDLLRRHHAGSSRDPVHELVHERAQAALAEYPVAGAGFAPRQAQRHADGRSRAGVVRRSPHDAPSDLFPAALRRSRQRLHHVADAGISRPRIPRLDRGGVFDRRDPEARHSERVVGEIQDLDHRSQQPRTRHHVEPSAPAARHVLRPAARSAGTRRVGARLLVSRS